MVKVSSSSNIWSTFWPGLQLLLHWIPASVVSSHRQINIPRSYICQYFYPSHVLEHWKYAEIWWCWQMHECCTHLYVFNAAFNTRRVCHQKNYQVNLVSIWHWICHFKLKFLLELSMYSSPLVLLCLFPHEYPVSVCSWGKLWQSCTDILASFRCE